jgi:hypothetical protein
MGLTVGRYQFEGPYTSVDSLQDTSGVYVIVDSVNEKYNPIDCGESAAVKIRVGNHDRADCWKRNSSGILMVAVFYTPRLQSAGRIAIEQEIRSTYTFPCGVR